MFCVQAHKKHFGNRTTKEIKIDLKAAYQNRCKGVVFTGGEVTIRKDLIELIQYAKNLGFKSIQLQTNARMLRYLDFCKELIGAGVNEFSPAIHGHTPELHDYLTRSKGAFFQVIKAIKNLRSLNQYIITNSVICKPNYRNLPDMARMLVDLKVNQFQFAFMHAVGNAEKYYDKLMPRISMAAPFIKKGLQIGIDNKIKVMAEAMPFCTMEGYEKYCSENYIPATEIRDIDCVDLNFEKTRRTQGKKKFDKCKECIHYNICEGPWKEYQEKKGEEEFVPVK